MTCIACAHVSWWCLPFRICDHDMIRTSYISTLPIAHTPCMLTRAVKTPPHDVVLRGFFWMGSVAE